MALKEIYKVVFQDYPDVVDVSQMCEMLNICEKNGYDLLRENRIKHFKIGRVYKIPKYHIITFLSSTNSSTHSL